MSNLNKYIKEFLTFAKWEKHGILLLVVLIVGAVLFNLFYERPKVKPTKTKDISDKVNEYHKRVEEAQLAASTKYETKYSKPGYSKTTWAKSGEKSVLFDFDPNVVTEEQLVQLGFSEKQAKVIVAYREKGAYFYKTEDFKKMYVVSESHYNRLMPYIKIQTTKQDSIRVKSKVLLVDLNKADTSELIKLRGIGSKLANRIVKYRNRLGGFVTFSQLKEIYGIDSLRFSEITPQLKQLSSYRKIKINTVDLEDLKQHPYITPYEARNVIYYRSKKGSINDVNVLKKEKLVASERFEKLKDYIDCTK